MLSPATTLKRLCETQPFEALRARAHRPLRLRIRDMPRALRTLEAAQRERPAPVQHADKRGASAFSPWRVNRTPPPPGAATKLHRHDEQEDHYPHDGRKQAQFPPPPWAAPPMTVSRAKIRPRVVPARSARNG